MNWTNKPAHPDDLVEVTADNWRTWGRFQCIGEGTYRYLLEVEPGEAQRVHPFRGCVVAYTGEYTARIVSQWTVRDETTDAQTIRPAQRVPVGEAQPLPQPVHAQLAEIPQTSHEQGAPVQVALF